MNSATPPEPQSLWTLLHDLIFGVPASTLTAVEYISVLLGVVALSGCAVRIWKGDRIEVGPLKLERSQIVRGLQSALEGLSNDDKLKTNVLWMFRDRLGEANRIISEGTAEPRVHAWTGGVLTDVATALSRGGYDRHRTSLWIRAGAELRIYNGNGFRQAALDHATLPLESIAGNVLKTGTTYNSADIGSDRAFFPKPRSGRPFQSLLAVPVKSPAGAVIATLCIDAETRAYFDRDDEFFASSFAELLALLIAQTITGDNACTTIDTPPALQSKQSTQRSTPIGRPY